MQSSPGLVLFAAGAWAFDPVRARICALVVCNGLAYHATAGRRVWPARPLFWWDVLCNAILVAYVNWASERQPRTLAATALAVAAWACTFLVGVPWTHLLHVVGVQGVLFACLATAW
jgi:hypothetical protein